MDKKFDPVAFQRKRRSELSKKIAMMKPTEISRFFNAKTPPKKKAKAA